MPGEVFIDLTGNWFLFGKTNAKKVELMRTRPVSDMEVMMRLQALLPIWVKTQRELVGIV